MEEQKFEGFNSYPLNLYTWDKVKSPKAVVQLSHGMVEHLGRYDEFAKFLNTNNYIVVGEDHRGHGKSAESVLGVTSDGDCFNNTVRDIIKIGEYAKEKYKLPVLLFSHSYGSFLTQRVIQLASQNYDGVVLCGSAKQYGADIKCARILSKIQAAFIGEDKPAKLINKLSFGAYNNKFRKKTPPQDRSPFMWGSRDMNSNNAYIKDKYCAFVMSIGFYKSFFNGLKSLYKKSSMYGIRKELPIYIISGDCDPVGKDGKLVVKLFNAYKKKGLENVKIKLYPEARHELLNELNKQEVYSDVLGFFDECMSNNDKQQTVE